jgi:hypothetical protein
MNSVKCPQCGLVYWVTNENCKRCGLATAETPVEQPPFHAPPPSYRGGKPSGVASTFDEEEMIRKLKRNSYLFYFIGGLQILAWFIVGNLLIVDGVFNIGLSFIANKFRSRIAAVVLLVVTILSVLVAMASLAMGAIRFNILVPMVLLGRLAASIQIVSCTFKLNSLVAENVTQVTPPPPPSFPDESKLQWEQQPLGASQ